jgi:hypothetical protein
MSGGHGEKLTRKQEAAVAALLGCPTIGEAATATGVGEATLRRWLHQPDFQNQYREARAQAVDAAVGNLQQACTGAVKTLRAVMTDVTAPPGTRVQAAKAVLEVALRGIEIDELLGRISELERICESISASQKA